MSRSGAGGGSSTGRRRRPRDSDNNNSNYIRGPVVPTRGEVPERIPKKSKVVVISDNNGVERTTTAVYDDMEDDSMEDPVAQARKALEMFHEVTGEGLDDNNIVHHDAAEEDGQADENVTTSHGHKDDKLLGDNDVGTGHGRKSPTGRRRNNGMTSTKVGTETPVQVSEATQDKKRKELEEEEARRRKKRKEDGEAQRRAFRPTIATVQDASCLL